MPFARLLLALILALAPLSAPAQDRADTILVLDASGSMWGQIDGVAKITIAQQVVGGLLDTLPDDLNLGLTVYGHRRKGDCADIETLVAPGPGTRAAIRAAVDAIQPKGKTPMTDAVIAAAKALRFTEEAATVILVSDGIETCNPDPCAAARVLEATGVAFTAHVVGFDVSDKDALRQMACIAAETGGRFLPARDAAELAAALSEVAAPPEPPAPIRVDFRATLGAGGPVIGGGLLWTLIGPEGPVIAQEAAAAPSLELDPGDYTVSVIRLSDEETAEARFRRGDVPMTVTLVLPEVLPKVTISAIATAPVGATIDVAWGGDPDPDGGDFIGAARVGDDAEAYGTYAYTAEGNPARLRLPLIPGSYELRYFSAASGRPDRVLARRPIGITDLTVALDAALTGTAGAELAVTHDGPAYQGDYVAVAAIGSGDSEYLTYAHVGTGDPLKVTLPNEPGSYELRYVASGAPDRVLGRRSVTVTDISATLEAPDSAAGGSEVSVTWSGPDNRGDFIAVAREGDAPDRYLSYAYTNAGNPAKVAMPTDAGRYELRYVARGRPDRIIGRRAIAVTDISATLEAPDSAAGGSEVSVTWSGPDNRGDFIAVAREGDAPDRYLSYAYTNAGNPAKVTMPTDAGRYELRYVARGRPDRIIGRRAIAVTDISATLEAPDSAAGGSEVSVTWSGPDNRGDFIAVAREGDAPDSYLGYAYTNAGNPAKVTMPTDAGRYELRYVARGRPDRIIGRRAITVTDIGATLEAADQAVQGSQLAVHWTGPGNRGDFIAVGQPGADPNDYYSYAYTRDGNPVKVEMPVTPGSYELRYVADGKPDKVIGSRAVTVTAAEMSLDAPERAIGGATIAVGWAGPGNARDFIAVALAGADAKDYLTYRYTRDGQPAQLLLPVAAGSYEIRYVAAGRPAQVLIRRPITLDAPTAALDAPASGPAGGKLSVAWTGPGYRNDYIAVALPGDDGYATYAYVRDGAPLGVKLPAAPGSYELRYVLGQDRSILARRPLIVE